MSDRITHSIIHAPPAAENRIDAAVLALLLLGLHDGQRAWKSFDWDVPRPATCGRLDLRSGRQSKSVMFTDEGLERARSLFQEMLAS